MGFTDPAWESIPTAMDDLRKEIATAPPDDTDQRVRELVELEEALVKMVEDANRLKFEATLDSGFGFGAFDSSARYGFYVADRLGRRGGLFEQPLAVILRCHTSVPDLIVALRATARGETRLGRL